MINENNDVGRPPYIKTDEDAKTVEALAIAGVKQSLISQALFKKAKDGNVVAQIFWLKTQAGWKEKNAIELTGKDGDRLFTEERQLIEIRKVFDEIDFSKSKNITETSILVQDSKNETDNS